MHDATTLGTRMFYLFAGCGIFLCLMIAASVVLDWLRRCLTPTQYVLIGVGRAQQVVVLAVYADATSADNALRDRQDAETRTPGLSHRIIDVSTQCVYGNCFQADPAARPEKPRTVLQSDY